VLKEDSQVKELARHAPGAGAPSSPLPEQKQLGEGRRWRRFGLVALAAVACGMVAATPALGDVRPVRSGVAFGRDYRDYRIARGAHRIFAREYLGRGPALVLLHGFPDNSHLYDALVPRLRGRRVVTFDFLGWGRSQRPQRRRYTFAGQQRDLGAVISGLRLDRVELVAHDAGVPAAVNWALDHAGQTASLTLMNGFYAPTPTARPPALIALLVLGQLPAGTSLGILPPEFASGLEPLARELVRNPVLFRRIFRWQERQFFSRRRDAKRYIPKFAAQFAGQRSSRGPLLSLAADLIPAVTANAARLPALAGAPFPMRLIWGARDPDLNVEMAGDLQRAVPRSQLHILANARHNLQIDEPGRVARLLTRSRPPSH
jgi:haloalkane dehalogenase